MDRWKKFGLIVFGVALLSVWIFASSVLAESGLRLPASMRVWAIAPGAEAVSVGADDGVVLRGALFQPSVEARGAVILLHGIGDHGFTMRGLAELLNRNGYVALTPDSRGHGGSGGEFVTYGLLEAGDVHRWVDLLEARTGQGFPMYGYGASLGGGIIIESLAKESRFRALIAESPFADFHRVAYDRLAERMDGVPQFVLGFVVEPAILYARMRYGLDLERGSPIEALRKDTKVPVLLMHGRLDRNIPIEHSRLLHVANPAMTELWEIPKAGHVETWAVTGAEFERRVLGWYASH